MFRTPILAVKINSNRIVVVRETELSLYSVADMALLATLETPPNPRGVCAISESSIIAYPSQSDKGEYVLYDALALRVKRVVSAHKERLRCLAFSPDASLIASASESVRDFFGVQVGPLFHLYLYCTFLQGAWVKISPVDEKDGRIWQFRRGISPALIDSIAFNEEQSLLCCSSPNGTVHIFRVPPNPEAMTTPHNGNGNSPVGMGYLNSLFPDAGLRAAATIKFTPGLNSLCGFSPDSTRVYTVTSDGKARLKLLNFIDRLMNELLTNYAVLPVSARLCLPFM
jgi:autophagy-related protein 18